MIKRTLEQLLKAWGGWERHKNNYLAHLNSKSAMLQIEVLNVRRDEPPLPELNDEEAAWVCDQMSKILRQYTSHYQLLKFAYVVGLSAEQMVSNPDVIIIVGKVSPYVMRQKISKAEGVALVFLHDRVCGEEAA